MPTISIYRVVRFQDYALLYDEDDLDRLAFNIIRVPDGEGAAEFKGHLTNAVHVLASKGRSV